jgi:hypothetical protein
MLTVVVEDGNCSDEIRTSMQDLVARIPPEQLHAPVVELLRRAGEAD